MCFDQRFEADVPGKVDQPGKATRRMEDRQQQDDIGPGRAQQRQLTSIDHELLGENRDAHGRTHGADVVDRPRKPVRLAQHRDRARPAGLVGAGARHDILVRLDDSTR